MKRIIYILLIILLIVNLFLMISCNFLPDNAHPGNAAGSLTIKFNLGEPAVSKSITSDFSQVAAGEMFLQQGSTIKYQRDLAIDTVNKSGQSTISGIVIGNYDVILELYNSASEVIYSGADDVVINPDSTSIVTIPLSKNSATLIVTGNWTEDMSNLATGLIQLKESSNVRYAGNMVMDAINKKVTGGIINIQPGAYEICIEIKDASGIICFTVCQAIIIHMNYNELILNLLIKTGDVLVNITGDVSAPVITAAPVVTVAGDTATITWATNENATSNVCYSATPGFNYQISTDWAPVGRDLTTDTVNHNITIQELAPNQTYYYLIVCTDAAGNMFVSDEESFVTVGN